MDWADDTAYAINDMMDSITGGFITIARLNSWSKGNNLTKDQKQIINNIEDWIRSGNYKQKLSAQIGEFISACDIKERKTFLDKLTNRYKYKLIVDSNILDKANLYKKIAVDLVFRSAQLHQMEFKGNHMISSIFRVFFDNYVYKTTNFKLLPDFTHNIILKEKNRSKRARLVCDNISGMTDNFAMKTYRRLFDPDYSSLSDLV
jgi:dGTPase